MKQMMFLSKYSILEDRKMIRISFFSRPSISDNFPHFHSPTSRNENITTKIKKSMTEEERQIRQTFKFIEPHPDLPLRSAYHPGRHHKYSSISSAAKYDSTSSQSRPLLPLISLVLHRKSGHMSAHLMRPLS